MNIVYDNIRVYKECFNYDVKIYISRITTIQASLRPLSYLDLADDDLIELLTKWRKENYDAYPSQFNVTVERTRRWLAKYVLKAENKVLFLLEDLDKRKIGHMGMANYDPDKKRIEMDNIVRGNKESIHKGIMTNALYDLISWTFLSFPIESVFLRVFKDNSRAISLYERLKFAETKLIPLKRIETKDEVKFIEIDESIEADRYFSLMELKKNDHFSNYSVKFGE